jgi:hypothetical protein
MNIIAHRGIWDSQVKRNSLQALTSSFDLDIGVETDIRDCDGMLVISHDPPRAVDALKVDFLFRSYVERSSRPVLALNIKSDGLYEPLLALLKRYGIENYFVFDMSVPDTLGYQRLQMPFAARISEYESHNELTEVAKWIWLDAFHDEWFTAETIKFWLDQGKCVAVVSPELHQRPHKALWSKLLPIHTEDRLYLCTDYVHNAQEYFDVSKN